MPMFCVANPSIIVGPKLLFTVRLDVDHPKTKGLVDSSIWNNIFQQITHERLLLSMKVEMATFQPAMISKRLLSAVAIENHSSSLL